MIRRPDDSLTPEQQALDAYTDLLARNPEMAPPPADELQAFSARLFQSTPSMTPEKLARDPILAMLLAKQRELNEAEHYDRLPASAGDARLRRTTTEARRAVLWARSFHRGTNEDGVAAASADDTIAYPVASSSRLPVFSYLAAFVVLCVVALSLYAITLTGDDTRVGGPDNPGVGETVSISDQAPSVVINDVEFQIRDRTRVEVVGTGETEELPFRGTFVVVELVVENQDTVAKLVPFYGLLIETELQEMFSIDIPATVLNQAEEGGIAVVDTLIEPNEAQLVILVFDVPGVSTSFQLTNIDKTFSLPLAQP